MHTDSSQSRTRSGQGALFLSLFALVWDVLVLKLLLPLNGPPLWFKAVFVIAGAAVTWAALYAWRQQLKGGSVSLSLSSDPVPHGATVTAVFHLDRSIPADDWQVEAKIESSGRHHSGFGLVWRQDCPARAMDSHRVVAEVTLPADYPSTAASGNGTTYRVTLTLKAQGIEWTFNLKSRGASASETQFGARDSITLGHKRPADPPAHATAAHKRLKAGMYGLAILVLAWHLSSFFDLDLWPRAKALAGGDAYPTAVETQAFEVRASNHLINDWALRGRLIGTARVANGVLWVRIESLAVQPVGACVADSRLCEIESVSLLLTRDGEQNFSVLASSEAIPVHANLKEVTRWTLPPGQAGVEIRMPLPPVLAADGVRLKLQIRSADGSTVYPDHGPHLNLQRALARATGGTDPCERVTDKRELVRAGCTEQLQIALQRTELPVGRWDTAWAWIRKHTRALAARLGLTPAVAPAHDTPDELLLEALRTENFLAVPVLLGAGASPDAHSPRDKGRTALGYAAAANDVDMVERLLLAGARVNAREANEQGQIVTPLTQALRTDAAATVRRLLQAGATPSTQDPTGWTPMHIAAYESAHLSLAELVQAGADVNERTPAYRQQTVLQTALQFGSIETVRTLLRLGADRQLSDKQGQNACDWARFFKRSEPMQSLVCN